MPQLTLPVGEILGEVDVQLRKNRCYAENWFSATWLKAVLCRELKV